MSFYNDNLLGYLEWMNSEFPAIDRGSFFSALSAFFFLLALSLITGGIFSVPVMLSKESSCYFSDWFCFILQYLPRLMLKKNAEYAECLFVTVKYGFAVYYAIAINMSREKKRSVS
ncbi:MAG: hypothetical protein LBQ54_02490 [Planctomycetaceae bacterium]|nr:hypothetical protein [Planctomycetaceae bacterium]